MSTAPERKPPYPIGAGIRALSVARDEEHSAPGACIGQGRAGDGTRLRRAMCGCLAQHAAWTAVRHMLVVAAVRDLASCTGQMRRESRPAERQDAARAVQQYSPGCPAAASACARLGRGMHVLCGRGAAHAEAAVANRPRLDFLRRSNNEKGMLQGRSGADLQSCEKRLV